jgi:hypothetical protein
MKKQINSVLFCIILGLFSFKTNIINAQNKGSKKDKKETTNYIKAYLESSFNEYSTVHNSTNLSYLTRLKKFSIYPSFAFSKIRQNSSLFEMSFALQDLEIRDDLVENRFDTISKIPERGEKVFSLAIGSRFEWAWRINQNEKHGFYVGVSENFTFTYYNITPYTTSSFPFYRYALTTGISIVPRWCWHLTDRFLMDVNVPIDFLQGGINYIYSGNPALPTFARNKDDIFANFVLKPQFRIGFGLKI